MNRRLPPRGIRPRRGFTLLEVMLALGMFVIIGVSLAVCLSQILDAATQARRLTHIQLNLGTYLAESRVKKLAPGAEEIGTDSDGVRYKRNVEMLNFKDVTGHSLPSLYRLTISAQWRTAGTTHERTANLYVYQP